MKHIKLISAVLILITLTCKLPLFATVILLTICCLMSFACLRKRAILKRKLFFDITFNRSSKFMFFKNRMFLLNILLFLVSVILSFSVILFCYRKGLHFTALTIVGALIGLYIGKWIGTRLLKSLRSEYAECYNYNLTLKGTIIGAILFSIIYDFNSTEFNRNYKEVSPSELATEIASKYDHPVKFIRYAARGLDYIDVSRLRMRDSLKESEWAVAHILALAFYIVSLLPEVIALTGISAIIIGVNEIRISNKYIDEK